MASPDQAAANELVITVYLDTNALLDLLATVEDGFTLVERVTSGQSSGNTSDRSGEASFGAPGVFNFFKLGLSGKLAKSTNDARSDKTESEITHTYGSLLHRLRRYLIEEKLLTTVTADSPATAPVGTFIEFTGVARPNPFTATFRQLRSMLDYVSVAAALEGGESSAPPRPGNGRQGRSSGGGQPRKPTNNSMNAQLKAMSDFIEQLTADVEREGTSTIILESETSKYRALITIYDDFLRDRSMAELLNREFRVLGKIARHLPEDSDEKVDLLASSGIAGFPPETLGELSQAVTEMSRSGAAKLATPSTVIEPPVIEILPVAIADLHDWDDKLRPAVTRRQLDVQFGDRTEIDKTEAEKMRRVAREDLAPVQFMTPEEVAGKARYAVMIREAILSICSNLNPEQKM